MMLGRKLFNTLVVILAIVAVAVDGLFIWWMIVNKDLKTQYTYFAESITIENQAPTVGGNNIQTDELPTLELTYYSNEDNMDGYVLGEIAVNYYTDPDTKTLYKAGYQYCGPLNIFDKDLYKAQLEAYFDGYGTTYKAYRALKNLDNAEGSLATAIQAITPDMERSMKTYDALYVADITGPMKAKDYKGSILYSKNPAVDNFVKKGYFSVYDGADNSGVTGYWDTTSDTMTPDSGYIVPIGDELFRVQCNRNTFNVDNGGLKGVNKSFYGDYYTTWGYMMADIMTALHSNSIGTGKFKLPLKLSKYFTMQIWDAKENVWSDLPQATLNELYWTVLINYNRGGCTSASQSMFGVVGSNRLWQSEDFESDLWQAHYCVTLDDDDFIYRDSEIYGGKLVSLKDDVKTRLNNIRDVEIDIMIDASKCVGVDVLGFSDLYNVNRVILYNSTSDVLSYAFTIHRSAFAGTEVKELWDNSFGAFELVIDDAAFDKEMEVILG